MEEIKEIKQQLDIIINKVVIIMKYDINTIIKYQSNIQSFNTLSILISK